MKEHNKPHIMNEDCYNNPECMESLKTEQEKHEEWEKEFFYTVPTIEFTDKVVSVELVKDFIRNLLQKQSADFTARKERLLKYTVSSNDCQNIMVIPLSAVKTILEIS